MEFLFKNWVKIRKTDKTRLVTGNPLFHLLHKTRPLILTISDFQLLLMMFFILSKTLYYIMMPIVWVSIILLFAVFTKNQKRRKKSIVTALVMILFFSNEFIVNEFYLLWEKEPVAVSSLKNYETAIVLTGITNTEKKFDDRVFFQRGADRLLHTVQLYKTGKIKKILISGGSGLVVGTQPAPEADRLKVVFLYCGVPEKDLILENKSRNTYENAVSSKKIIDSLQGNEKFLLITSAFHMRRAEDCFTKAGAAVDIFPVDFYSRDRKFTPNILIIPSEGAFGRWSLLIHEILGYVVYKILGYC